MVSSLEFDTRFPVPIFIPSGELFHFASGVPFRSKLSFLEI